jgi:hypothetical protein
LVVIARSYPLLIQCSVTVGYGGHDLEIHDKDDDLSFLNMVAVQFVKLNYHRVDEMIFGLYKSLMFGWTLTVPQNP